MQEQDIQKAHRWFAVECNNRAWDLAAKASRTPIEERDMLFTAYAAAFHWSKMEKPLNNMRAEHLLAHTHALSGNGAEATRYAKRVLEFCENNPCEDWDLAFAHSAMALAANVFGDRAQEQKHYALAQAQGQRIKDQEDREAFLTEFARIPKPADV